uniref:Carbohydrate-binding domain-containing protein n=1 Tax=Roseihalotalea indica TaxID=2867963 RepID=A0AA49GPZ4_9BACT|nr:carbohydrate-binding domain-containing protein [Tunicatimonas sp. TK19036]
MMRKRAIRVVISGIILVLLGAILFGKKELFYFLAPTHRVDASVLVVEGWISEEALQQVLDELDQHSYDQIIVTSVAYEPVFRMYSQGALVFQIREKEQPTRSFQTLKVRSCGASAGGIQAHAKVRVNSTLIGEFTASSYPDWYAFPLPDTLSVDSVSIIYDNNQRIGKEDRDLYVFGIQLDSLWASARHPSVHYDRNKVDGKDVLRTDYSGSAEEASAFLIKHGVDRHRLHTLTAPRVDYERTYASVLEVKKFLPDSVTAINVFSESVHSRRSWLVYQKTLDDSFNVGIIAAASPHELPDSWWVQSGSRNYVLLQLAKYLYARFLFYP